MRDKARDFFEEAKVLCAAKKFNGAASRLYYSLYHGIVAGFEDNGIKQSDLTRKVDPEKSGYWLHEIVRDCSTLAGVERRDAGFIRAAWKLRVKSDYEDKHVMPADCIDLIPRVKKILGDLDVSI